MSRLELRGVHKDFSGVEVLHGVDLSGDAGEVIGVVGANGAGKSTLIKILSGALPMSQGEMRMDGERVALRSPHDAHDHGIRTVYQELSLVPELSVTENLLMGSFPRRLGLIDWPAAHARAQQLLDRVGFGAINPKSKAGRLSVARQQPKGNLGSANAVDGNVGSYWESNDNAFPQWVQVDLGAAYALTRVVLKLPAAWAARTQTLSVQGSSDGASFTTIGPSTGYQFTPANSNTVTINLTATARYLRVNVTANNGATAAQLAELEAFGSVVVPTGTSLRSRANNLYVSAVGTSPLIANKSAVGATERFDVIDRGGGNVALRSRSNNMYVCAENAGAAPLVANRAAIGGWETFALIRNANGTVSLRAQANNMYVCADNAGAAALIANRTAIGPWEQFDMITS